MADPAGRPARTPGAALAAMAAGAATPLERLGPAFVPVAPAGAEARDRLAAWRRQAANGDPAGFAKLLAWHGLEEASALRALGPVRLRNPARLPPWARFWGAVLAAAAAAPEFAQGAEPGPPVPFQELLGPLAGTVCRRLRADPAVPSGLLSGAAWADLERQLLGRFLTLAGPALLAEFGRFRHPWVASIDLVLAGPGRPPGDAVYRAFVQRLRGEGALLGFFARHSALARLLAELALNWTAAWREALVRLDQDGAAIRAGWFAGADPGPVARIAAGAGDPHNHGRATAILRFPGGVRLVYKPVPAGIDAAWYRLLDWVAARGGPGPLRPLRHLARPGHGWSEFVDPAPCPDAGAVERFYRRCGVLLGLVHLLGGGDGHLENLIAAGEQPILLDLETVMAPEFPRVGSGEPQASPLPGLPALALRTGLLPCWHRIGDRAEDFSAFGPCQPQPQQGLCWRHSNTDCMTLAPRLLPPRPRTHLPLLAGQPASPLEHVEAIAEGFQGIHRFLREHRDALAAADGPLAGFAGQTLRVVPRDTSTYWQLLLLSCEPGCLRDGADRAVQLAGLCRAFLAHPTPARFLPLADREREALAEGDIPYFATASDGTDFLDGAGRTVLPAGLAQSCLEAARQRLAAMDAADLECQLRVIRASFQLLGEPPPAPAPGPGPALAGPEAVAAAAELAAELQRLAWAGPGGGSAWLTLHPAGAGLAREVVGWAGLDLCAGNAGIGLFLAALARLTGALEHRAWARAALLPLCQGLAGPAPELPSRLPGLHGLRGLGGVVYALVQAGRLLGEADWLDPAARAAALIPPGPPAPGRCDLLDGGAGTLAGLLSLWRATGSAAVLAQAGACGRQLLRSGMAQADGSLAWASAPGPPLTGFSQGAAGIGFALASLARATGQPDFLDAARAASRWEDAQFSPEWQNWADLRPATPEAGRYAQAGWAHGAPGIALGRLASLEALDGPEFRAAIEAGAAACAAPAGGAGLAGGGLGRADILLDLGRRLSRPDLEATARARISAQARAARSARGGWHLGGPEALARPDLFQGLAGLGYALLRLARPEVVPCVLRLDPGGERERGPGGRGRGRVAVGRGSRTEGRPPFDTINY